MWGQHPHGGWDQLEATVNLKIGTCDFYFNGARSAQAVSSETRRVSR